ACCDTSETHEVDIVSLHDALPIFDRLPAAGLGAGGLQDERVAAELVDAHGEGDTGAGRGLVEEDGDRPSLERTRRRPARLEREGELEDGPLALDAEVVVPQEVGGHAAPPASSTAGRSATNWAACSALRMNGGASRMA